MSDYLLPFLNRSCSFANASAFSAETGSPKFRKTLNRLLPPRVIEIELKTEGADPIHVTGLFHGEGSTQFLPPNMHVQGTLGFLVFNLRP